MKPLLTICFCFFVVCCYSQQTDSCYKKNRIASCNIDSDKVSVDTVKPAVFTSILINLYHKLSGNKELLLEEDRMIVLVMNTLFWSDLFNQPFIEKKFPLILRIDTIFNKHYERMLYCKYSVCRGAGFTPYFKELHAQYIGNPYACDRYFIKD